MRGTLLKSGEILHTKRSAKSLLEVLHILRFVLKWEREKARERRTSAFPLHAWSTIGPTHRANMSSEHRAHLDERQKQLLL